MRDLFTEILDIRGVEGMVVFDTGGAIHFGDLKSNPIKRLESLSGKSLIHLFSDINEAELLFQQYRIYIRKAQSALILVVMKDCDQISKVRLNCNILLSELAEKIKKPRGIGRFFKRT